VEKLIKWKSAKNQEVNLHRNLRFFIAAVFAIFLGRDGAIATSPDLILINGKIITVDPKDTITQAIAIADGRISTAGFR
jgi:hypothetical protein